MGDASSLDVDLDFRVDVVYLGSVICRGGTSSPCNGSNPVWRGALWRLTTNQGSTDLDTWGVGGAPKKLISTFTCDNAVATCPTVVGPVVAAPTISIDDKNNFWVFFGSGRLITTLDKTNEDTQYFFGVKDCFISNVCGTQIENQHHNLRDVSNIVICTDPNTTRCDPLQTVSTDGGGTFSQRFDDPNSTTSLVQDVQGRDGWFTTLPAIRERSLTKATILGGTIVFGTFSPSDSTCDFSGDARLYALFYLTGTGYAASALGDSLVGGTLVANTSVLIGSGMSSEVALHVGGRGPGTAGAPGVGGPAVTAGCRSGLTAIAGLSSGGVTDTCVQPAFRIWSALVSWRDL
jgi:type IV pilus assembly protein PilY1